MPRHKAANLPPSETLLDADMLQYDSAMLTIGDDETSPFTPHGVVNTPYGQTPQVCTVFSDRVIRSDTHYLSPPCPSARNTSCMALRSDPERPTDTIRLAVRACSGQDPLLRLSLSGAPTGLQTGMVRRREERSDARNYVPADLA